jgi:hypothetical protein
MPLGSDATTDVEMQDMPLHVAASDRVTIRELIWPLVGMISIICAPVFLLIYAMSRETVFLNLGIFFSVVIACILCAYHADVRRCCSQCSKYKEHALFTLCGLSSAAFAAGVFALVFFHFTKSHIPRDLGIVFVVCGGLALCALRKKFMFVVNKLVAHPKIRMEIALLVCTASTCVIIALTSIPLPVEGQKRGNRQGALACMSIITGFSGMVILAGYKEIFVCITECCGCD